jgi:hypothetical protein
MKFVSNAGVDSVVDLVRPWLKANHQLDAVSPSFSLFAFAEILDNVAHLSNVRIVVPPLPASGSTVGAHEQLGLLGTRADRSARNKLQAPWLARKFSAWLDSKAHVRHASGAIPQGTLVLRDDQGVALESLSMRTDSKLQCIKLEVASFDVCPKYCLQGSSKTTLNRSRWAWDYLPSRFVRVGRCTKVLP